MADVLPPINTPAWRRRTSIMVVASFVVGGLLIFQHFMPVGLELSFGVPPVVRVDDRGVPREQVVAVDATIVDEEGAELARIQQRFPNGMNAPITPNATVKLPRGEYAARAVLELQDGRRVHRAGKLVVDGDPWVRVDL